MIGEGDMCVWSGHCTVVDSEHVKSMCSTHYLTCSSYSQYRMVKLSFFLFLPLPLSSFPLQELLEMQVAGEVDGLRNNLVLLERSTIDTLRSENEVKLPYNLLTHIVLHVHVS